MTEAKEMMDGTKEDIKDTAGTMADQEGMAEKDLLGLNKLNDLRNPPDIEGTLDSQTAENKAMGDILQKEDQEKNEM